MKHAAALPMMMVVIVVAGVEHFSLLMHVVGEVLLDDVVVLYCTVSTKVDT